MNTNLPVFKYRKEIIDSIRDNAVTIITAETGSGKSTQICQYLYEEGYDVIVTEPRRLAVVSLASRVSEEMNDNNNIVAYKTAFESTEDDSTRILFCTDGLQLVRSLTRKTEHVKKKVLVIDEVHEWNLNQETLVAWVKMQIQLGWDIKVVIMSATIETEELSDYFGLSVKIISIPGTLYDVEFHTTDSDNMVSVIAKEIKWNHNVLVFVAGKKEISRVMDELNDLSLPAKILPLHGELTMEEQKACFLSYSQPKIVISTNVAQTSVTVPDIDVVVDSGEEKHIECREGVQGIFLNDISKADCMQRKGRAGRTKPGKYILCSDYNYNLRKEFSVPEIQRSILDQVVLRLAAVGINAEEVEFFHQPDKDNIVNSKITLENLGAIENNNITEIGKRMAKIPVSARYARMILEAEELGVVRDVITITAILEVGTLLHRKSEGYDSLCSEDSSDLLAELKIWNQIEEGKIKDFVNAGIHKKSYFRVKELRNKIEQILQYSMEISEGNDEEKIKMACIAGLADTLSIKVLSGEYESKTGETFRLDKKSCLSYYSEYRFVVGVHSKIEFSGKYGESLTMCIIRAATGVDIKYMLNKFPNLVSYKFNRKWDEYNPNRNSVTTLRETIYNGIVVESDYVEDNTAEIVQKAKEEYYRRIEGASYGKQKYVKIGEHMVKVSYSRYRDNGVIELSYTQLLEVDTTHVKLDDGEILEVWCEGITGTVPKAMIKQLEGKMLKKCRQTFAESLPKASTLKMSVIDEYIELLGKKEYYRSSEETYSSYVCLQVDSKRIRLALADTEEEANENNKEAMQLLLTNEILNKYGDKKFIVRIENKKVVTKKCEQAKSDFRELVNAAMAEVNVHNIKETLEFIGEAFVECTQDLGTKKYSESAKVS